MNHSVRLTLPVRITALDDVAIPAQARVLLPDPDRSTGARVVAMAELRRDGEYLMASFDLPYDCGVNEPERIECWTLPMVVRQPRNTVARPTIHGIMLRRIGR